MVHSKEALTQQEAKVAAYVTEAGVEVVDNVLLGDKSQKILSLHRPEKTREVTRPGQAGLSQNMSLSDVPAQPVTTQE